MYIQERGNKNKKKEGFMDGYEGGASDGGKTTRERE